METTIFKWKHKTLTKREKKTLKVAKGTWHQQHKAKTLEDWLEWTMGQNTGDTLGDTGYIYVWGQWGTGGNNQGRQEGKASNISNENRKPPERTSWRHPSHLKPYWGKLNCCASFNNRPAVVLKYQYKTWQRKQPAVQIFSLSNCSHHQGNHILTLFLFRAATASSDH